MEYLSHSEEETEAVLGFALPEPKSYETPSSWQERWREFRMEKGAAVEMGGKKFRGDGWVEFFDGELAVVRYVFNRTGDKELTEIYETVRTELTALYGEPTSVEDNSATAKQSASFQQNLRWDAPTGGSRLQLFRSGRDKGYVQIGLVYTLEEHRDQ